MPPQPRVHLRRLAPYEWEAFTSEIAARAGVSEAEVVRFDTNTSPWPPVAWEQTVLDLPRVAANEYPHPSNEPLRSAIARHLGVPADQIVVTCGADEALYLLANAYLGPEQRAVLMDPTFAMFRVVTETFGAAAVPVPVDDRWDLPAEPLLEALRSTRPAVAWLCSPNNPTGRMLPPETVRAACQAAPDTLVVLDEAYHEIAGATCAPLVAEMENLVLLRTFSKGYGLAGARVGYAYAAPSVARILDAVRPPQNISIFGLTAALRALQDQAGLQARVAQIRAERDLLGEELARRGWELVPSSANFILGRPPTDAARLADWLQEGALVVRSYRGHPRLNDWLRVTVRSPEENRCLLRRIDAAP